MDKHTNALNAYNTMIDHFTSNKLHITRDDDQMSVEIGFNGDGLPINIRFRVHEDRQVLRVLSIIPVRVPEEKRVEGAIAVAVANYGTVNGSFDYDMNDGEIRYRVCQSIHDGSTLSDETVRYIMAITYNTVKKYNDRFYMLGKGLMTLEDFIKKDKE